MMADEKILVDVRRIREQIAEWYYHGSGLERSILKDVLDLLDKEAADGITIRVGYESVASPKQVTLPRIWSSEWFISRWEYLRKCKKESG